MEKEITVKVNINTLNGLNNAIIAYGRILFAIVFGCDIPDAFIPLQNLPEDQLRERFNAIKDLYLTIEKELEEKI